MTSYALRTITSTSLSRIRVNQSQSTTQSGSMSILVIGTALLSRFVDDSPRSGSWVQILDAASCKDRVTSLLYFRMTSKFGRLVFSMTQLFTTHTRDVKWREDIQRNWPEGMPMQKCPISGKAVNGELTTVLAQRIVRGQWICYGEEPVCYVYEEYIRIWQESFIENGLLEIERVVKGEKQFRIHWMSCKLPRLI